MSAELPDLLHRLNTWRLRFRAWRGSRPFWAGLLTIAGGVPIGALPYYNIKLGNLSLQMATQAGAGGLIIGVLLVTLGLTMWFHSVVRVFAGVASIVLALVSIPVSNFGGLLVGFLLSMTGGALAVSWAPGGTAVDEADKAEEAEEADEADKDGKAEDDGPERRRAGVEPLGAHVLEDVDGGRHRAAG
ncbi:DUF6114 domain-containing protein [Streptomyces sp. WMMC500]|uniref:DUF6114 domain-containing protein n=1 Tax=Streptomyces sp. WMMC500 TaxID=3015154 RepID=UPI00248C8634|nr:DUF6114 domain-containing protein [Streptomyces sp. WMMC500]WBB62976.1 DUF6114 domain-containing protein [Streptomyces sp. WMMC500]